MATTNTMINLPVTGGGVTSLNSETGAINIVAGSNITVTPSGQNITIASTGGGGSPAGVTGDLQYNNAGSFAGTSFTTDGANLISPDFGFSTLVENQLANSFSLVGALGSIPWEGTLISVSVGVSAPDGSMNADTSDNTVAAGSYQRQSFFSFPLTATSWTMSIWLKGTTGTETVTLNMGTTSATGFISSVMTLTTAWKRYSFTFTGNGATNYYWILTGKQNNQLFYAWGPQLSNSSAPIPFVVTHAFPSKFNFPTDVSYGSATTALSVGQINLNGGFLDLGNDSWIQTNSSSEIDFQAPGGVNFGTAPVTASGYEFSIAGGAVIWGSAYIFADTGTNIMQITCASMVVNGYVSLPSQAGVLTLTSFDLTAGGRVNFDTASSVQADGAGNVSVTGNWPFQSSSSLPQQARVTYDGGGATITTGHKVWWSAQFAGTITGWVLLGDQSGSIDISVSKCTYAAFDTVSSITAANDPQITTAINNSDTTLTGWTTSILAGDILEFEVVSVTSFQHVQLFLNIAGV